MGLIPCLRTNNTFYKIVVYWKNENMSVTVYSQGSTGLARKAVLQGVKLLKVLARL